MHLTLLYAVYAYKYQLYNSYNNYNNYIITLRLTPKSPKKLLLHLHYIIKLFIVAKVKKLQGPLLLHSADVASEFNLPPCLSGIERVTSLKILGVTITDKLSMSEHVQSRLNVLGGPGPARLMGPLSSLWPTWRGGAVVLCTSESGNTHLGFNQGQT